MNKDFKARLYQEIIYDKAIKQNTMVVLPTGLGKTAIAAMLIKNRLTNYPNSKALILAPTKPLAQQHEKTLKKLLETYSDKIVLFTGTVSPEKRKKLFEENQIIISTPQGMENDIISRKIKLEEVSALVVDECLVGNTKITLFDNTEKEIKSVVSDWNSGKSIYVKSYDEKNENYITQRVTNAFKIPCLKKVYKISTSEGHEISSTEDHKFFVKRNNKVCWLQSSELCMSDMLATHKKIQILSNQKVLADEKDIINTYSNKYKQAVKKYYEIIGLRNKYKHGQVKLSKKTTISSRKVENYIYKNIKPVPIKTVEKMKELELLPFTYNNKHLMTISRIIGHLFGDGYISLDKKGTITLGFSGRREDLKSIQKDLNELKIKHSSIYSRQTVSESRNIIGTTNSFTCADVRLTKLIYFLAGFHGKKTTQKINIPSWILKGPIEVKKEFLGALFGSDGSNLKNKKNSQSFYSVRLTFNKLSTLKRTGAIFASQIKKMMTELDIKTSQIKKIEGTTWKTGETTDKFIITVSNSNTNIINFLQNVGYKYCKYKERAATQYLQYLEEKQIFKKQKKLEKKAVNWMIRTGQSNSQISKTLKISMNQIESWKYSDANILSYQSFHKPISDQRTEHSEIHWTKISKIEEINKIDFVYDLTVEKTHNFIANNIIVHNCHRATGDYAYVFVAKKYAEVAKHERILALTASPGSDTEKILEVCQNLHIEEIEYRHSEDEDVKPYVQEMDIKYIKLELPEELLKIKSFLDKCYISKLQEAIKLGYLQGSPGNYNKTALLGAISGLHGKIAQGDKDFSVLKTVSLLAESLKVHHAIELIETQGVHQTLQYLLSLETQALTSKTKAVKNLVQDLNFRSAVILAKSLDGKNIQHPKLEEVKRLLEIETSDNPKAKIILFTQFRDSAFKIKESLDELNISCEIFVGQAKKKNMGLSQKQQKEMIERFHNEEFRCLIATSVGEEGLDIPEVDLVLFYEPVPSAIRTVQRRGRTGRQKKGKVITLLTKDTRDESYRWAAHHKEKRMYRVLDSIKGKMHEHRPEKKAEKTLADYSEELDVPKILIKADYREKGSPVLKELLAENIDLDLVNLEIGDYLLSDYVIVEFKTVKDFVDSIIDGRLLNQAKELKQYRSPLIIIEGEEDIYSQRRIHPNAIRGMLSALMLNFKIPVLMTKNPRDTANMLRVIAEREQNKSDKDFQMHTTKPISDNEQQEYVVSSLPGIGARLAPFLLKHFKTIKNIVNADEKDLQDVELIGKKKAKDIKDLVEKEYDTN